MKYVSNPLYPLFNPMYNPKEMLSMGVFGGTAFKNKSTVFQTSYPKMPWNVSKWGMVWDASSNFFGVGAFHDVYALPQDGTYWTPVRWFEWYTDLYFNPVTRLDPDWDYYHISRWAHYLSHLYDNYEAQIEKGDPAYLQALLEIGYDGKFKPNFDTQWMRDKLPLKRFVHQT